MKWLVLLVVGLLWNAPFLLQAGGLEDEGVTSLGASRILLGEAPYRDFDTRHSPGSYYTAALGLKVLGSTQLSVRLLMLLNASLLGLALFALARQVLPGRWPWVAWLLFAWAGVTQWPILSYHWMATLAWLLGAVALLARRWTLVGVLGGVTFWYLQSEGAALGLATLLLLLLDRAPRPVWLRTAGAALVTSLVLWAPACLAAGPGALWEANFASMGRHVGFNHSPFALHHLTDPARGVQEHWSEGDWSWRLQSLSYLGTWSFKYGLYFPLLAWAAWRGWRQGGRMRDLVILQLVLTLALANRLDMLYQNYLTPAWYVLVLATVPSRALAAVLVAVFGVQYAYLCKDAQGYRYPIETPAGRLYTFEPERAQALNHLYGAARQLTPPGTRVLAYPYFASFYFLSGTRDATRYPVLVPVLYPRSAAVTAAAEREGCYIYRVPLSPALLADYPTVAAAEFQAESQAFDSLILQGYEQMGTAGAAEVWRPTARQSPEGRPSP